MLETLRNRIRDITDDYPIRSVLACVLVGVVVGALL